MSKQPRDESGRFTNAEDFGEAVHNFLTTPKESDKAMAELLEQAFEARQKEAERKEREYLAQFGLTPEELR